MSNALKLLRALDEGLDQPAELTLYGRAALQLGFENPPAEYAVSHDVDAVLWRGQAEALASGGNFWEVVEAVNRQFANEEIYIAHLFEEDQVVLQPNWRSHRVSLPGDWRKLRLYRLGDLDLFLSKLMRDDSLDIADARFIIERAGLSTDQIAHAIRSARVPDIPEIREQFDRCARRFLT